MTGIAGIVGLRAGLLDLPGVAVVVVDERDAWTELGVVGEVDVASSEG